VHLHRLAKEAFALVAQHLRDGRAIDEYAVQRFLLEGFEQAGLWTESPPIIGVNEHSADPHYQPDSTRSSPILRGDFLLIDLWAKEKAPGNVYADITWCGVCAASPTDRQQEVWNVDAAARDAGWDLVRSRYPHTPVRGFEVDDATRAVIVRAGYGERFIHRTGHGIGLEVHEPPYLVEGNVTALAPGMTFSIEPGIYLPERFGVRIEDIVAVTHEAAERFNEAPRDLTTVA
jgi:Xaa-Pro aminopeptidase